MEIWRVKVSDGTVHYFVARVEAEFFGKDTVEAGFSIMLSPIPLPKTPGDFADFMEGQERDRRQTEILLAEIEKVTPNWRAFRSLAEAVEVNIKLPRP